VLAGGDKARGLSGECSQNVFFATPAREAMPAIVIVA
jgi:hypothetical protein